MTVFSFLFFSLKAVQNERDKITRKPADETERVLSPQQLVSAELLSRQPHPLTGYAFNIVLAISHTSRYDYGICVHVHSC